ncbi:hypothetical protein ScPMuIL_017237 [Solemya velum]
MPPRLEFRDITEILAINLDTYVGSYSMTLKKADGNGYEPDTLLSYHRSIDRYLKENNYGFDLVNLEKLTTSRGVLCSRCKELNEMGLGNRPNKTDSLTENEEEKLWNSAAYLQQQKEMCNKDTPIVTSTRRNTPSSHDENVPYVTLTGRTDNSSMPIRNTEATCPIDSKILQARQLGHLSERVKYIPEKIIPAGSYLWKISTRTEGMCAIRCYESTDCTSLFFTEELGVQNCVGIATSEKPTNINPGDHVGWKYFRKVPYGKNDRTIQYIGCYVDREDRDIDGYHIENDLNTPQYCLKTCSEKGFKYAAVQYGRECFCGDSFGKYGAAPEAHCDYPCPNNHELMCGGFWSQNVYSYTKERLKSETILRNHATDVPSITIDQTLPIYVSGGHAISSRLLERNADEYRTHKCDVCSTTFAHRHF